MNICTLWLVNAIYPAAKGKKGGRGERGNRQRNQNEIMDENLCTNASLAWARVLTHKQTNKQTNKSKWMNVRSNRKKYRHSLASKTYTKITIVDYENTYIEIHKDIFFIFFGKCLYECTWFSFFLFPLPFDIDVTHLLACDWRFFQEHILGVPNDHT